MTGKPPLDPELIAELGDDAGLDVFEVAGLIKWFDVGKGFGFIVPDNGMKDILLHVTCLRRDGYQTAYEGAHCCRSVGPSAWPASASHSVDGRIDSAPSLTATSVAYSCADHADLRSGDGNGEMV